MSLHSFQVFSLHDGKASRTYHRQKPHNKTKSGCSWCKRKRAKCDGLRPVCTRCARHRRECVYLAQTGIKTSLQCIDSDLSVDEYIAVNWRSVFGTAGKGAMLLMASEHKIVRMSIRAMGAAHIRRTLPCKQHAIAEHHRQEAVLRELQQQIDRLSLADQSTTNALMLSAMVINMLAFALPADMNEHDLKQSWIYSDDENRLGWLSLQEGLRHLLRSAGPCLESAIDFLRSVFVADDSEDALPIKVLTDMPASWANILKDPAASDTAMMIVHHNALQDAVQVLLNMPHASGFFNMFQFFTFLLKINQAFRELLLERDYVAVWLVACWMELVSHRESTWWSRARVARDKEAIGLWFEEEAARVDGSVQMMLHSMMAELAGFRREMAVSVKC